MLDPDEFDKMADRDNMYILDTSGTVRRTTDYEKYKDFMISGKYMLKSTQVEKHSIISIFLGRKASDGTFFSTKVVKSGEKEEMVHKSFKIKDACLLQHEVLVNRIKEWYPEGTEVNEYDPNKDDDVWDDSEHVSNSGPNIADKLGIDPDKIIKLGDDL